jgi:hypothetical protein
LTKAHSAIDLVEKAQKEQPRSTMVLREAGTVYRKEREIASVRIMTKLA